MPNGSIMPNDLESLRWTCERALNWHGNRNAAELLAEIPSDLGVDRYGAGAPDTLRNALEDCGAIVGLVDDERILAAIV